MAAGRPPPTVAPMLVETRTEAIARRVPAAVRALVAALLGLAALGVGVAVFLARAVLAFDARGHGESAGATNALGWQGSADVAGAVAFTRRQPGVERVAVLGLSMGAEAGLRAAAAGVALAAVVADGAGASTAGDQRLLSGGVLPASVTWLALRGVELLGGGDEPPALADVAGRIRVPVLLVASGARDEYAIDAIYRRRIGARAALWSVPDAEHTQALARHPAAYAARVLGLLGSIG